MDDILIDIADFVNDDKISVDEQNAIRELYNSIYSKQIDSSNIVSYVVLLMKIINSHKNIENIDKKKFVIFVLNKFVEFNITDENEAYIIKMFINNILPNMIDTMISIDNKEIIIKTENYVFTLCQRLRKMFCCIQS
jgi:hypothetical protein|uniref:Uncharacterized protein n=1 Tax=viral metagenome TaxID=1070528 RepID=A0A6C0E1P2_9ZZZZ